MPLHKGTSREVVSTNIREMQAAGHPHDQAVAAALREKDQSGGAHASHVQHAIKRHKGGMEGHPSTWY